MVKTSKKISKLAINCAVSFGIAVVIYTIISLCFGNSQIEAAVIFQFLALSALTSALQLLLFTDIVFKKMRYSVRMTLFFIPLLAVLTGFAVWFEWFPVEYLNAWLIFFGIFIAWFVILTIIFEIVFRITGKKYDGLLGEYKRKKEEAEKLK